MNGKHRPKTKPMRNRLPAGYRPVASDWKELRERHEISQGKLAARLLSGGIGIRIIKAYERGVRQAHPSMWRYVLAQMDELTLPEKLKIDPKKFD